MAPAKPGKLTIFLGYAAGVGKTYRMLLEGERAARAGRDVVIGYFEPHARPDTIALAATFETVPRRALEYRGRSFEEMDTDAVLRRAPDICLVDEFAHTNVPGSPRAKRWQDVQELLAAGLDVYTTLNVQHLESLNDQVFQISGVRVRETVPDWVVRQASELVMVDLSTRALLNRLERGAIYSPAKAQAALANFFREPTLVALRELALRHTAHEIEVRQPQPQPARARPAERILVHVTAEPSAVMILRRGWRMANYLGAECFAVHVHPPGRALAADAARHLEFARNLRIQTEVLEGVRPAEALAEFARSRQVTQIFLARPRPTSAARAFVARLVGLAHDRQVIIVAERR
jgi:two-component system sensor histidine kinase KdpD